MTNEPFEHDDGSVARPAAAHSALTEEQRARKARAHRRFLIKRGALLVLLAIGLGIMFYPAFYRAKFLYKSVQEANAYDEALAAFPESELEQEWHLARVYNEARQWNLFHDENVIVDPFKQDEETRALNTEYAALLNPLGNGVMGYIDIPKIHQRLNIFHGTDENALLQGVGHVQGTSLPVGGESSHCVLSAHRGLPVAKLFTDLDQLEVGDKFYLHILKHDMAYEVDQIEIVLPEDIGSLDIVKGEDLVTLLTCTPYAVNTHRLLVRGHSVPYDLEEDVVTRALSWLTPARLLLLVLVVLLVAGICGFLWWRRRREKAEATGRHLK